METKTRQPIPQVNAPDPERKCSPIIDESQLDEHAGAPDLELEAGVCYFNGESFPIGSLVRSGAEVLRCTRRGVWAKLGDKRTDEER